MILWILFTIFANIITGIKTKPPLLQIAKNIMLVGAEKYYYPYA